MPSNEGLEEAVETALTRLIDAIYLRSEALAQNVSADKCSALDRKVSETEESWKLARQQLQIARQPVAGRPEASAMPAATPAKYCSA